MVPLTKRGDAPGSTICNRVGLGSGTERNLWSIAAEKPPSPIVFISRTDAALTIKPDLVSAAAVGDSIVERSQLSSMCRWKRRRSPRIETKNTEPPARTPIAWRTARVIPKRTVRGGSNRSRVAVVNMPWTIAQPRARRAMRERTVALPRSR